MKARRKHLVYSLPLISIFLLFGCGGKAKEIPQHEVTKPQKPEWVEKGSGAFGGEMGKAFYGVGSTYGIKNPSLLRSSADNRARTEVARVFKTYTASLMKDYQAFGAHYGDFDPDEQGRMKQMEKQLAEKRLDEICEKFLNQCPLFFRHILVGDPAAQILKFIDDHDIDFVVMASCGDEAHFDFGSVADRAVRCARVPVVTVPASDSCKLGA